ncbi:hypothetical protein FRB99_002520 [Tulasnella sp. 403]|nr:hypothetical protein FRB99_002520 [Tulasnella sp. 403]
MKLSAGLAALAALISASGVSAVSEWGQCGGINWTGGTACDAGLTCVYLNDWYYQCLRVTTSTRPASTSPSSSVRSSSSNTRSPTTVRTASTTTRTSSKTSSSAAQTSAPPSRVKFQYFGVNESCAEFGNTKIPGVYNTDYTWPTTQSIDYFLGKGFNTFRIAFLMERLSPPATGLTGPFDATYLGQLKQTVSYVTSHGGYAIIDPHNFLRYNGGVITDQNAFATWWKNLANEFKSDSRVVFDLNNEPHDVAASSVVAISQAAINAIRSSGATSQLILVEGTSWTGAWTWTTSSGNAQAFANNAITDPSNNFAIEMHQYLDTDGSGTDPNCVSSTIGADRISAATQWLKDNGYKGFLGEIGAGSNDQCIAALEGAFTLMQQPDTPWIGALWWAAGPWWGNYYQSIEPPDGPAIARILPEALQPFL